MHTQNTWTILVNNNLFEVDSKASYYYSLSTAHSR